MSKFVSLYLNNTSSTNPQNLDLDLIFDSIQNGDYEERYNLYKVRLAKKAFRVEEERLELSGMPTADFKKDTKYLHAKNVLDMLKNSIPRITIAGVFGDEGRKESNISKASGFIDIDIDKIGDEDEIEELKEKLSKDPYTYACFKSCGGDGLCLIFHIDYKKYKESFEGIRNYLFEVYGISLDEVHSNIANTRNLSSDSTLYKASKIPPIFNRLPPKPKKVKEEKVLNFVYAKSDFEACVKEIVARNIDFCPNYQLYCDIGFAIASKFGLSGVDYFDAICQFGASYNSAKCAKHYKYFCRDTGTSKINISTFFYHCKQHKIEIYSKETKEISSAASHAWKSGKNKEDVIKNLEYHCGLTREQTEDIVNQVFDNKIEFISSEGILDEIQSFIKYNYSLTYNLITGKLENNDIELTESDVNSIHIAVKKAIDKADVKWMERIMKSDFVEVKNPLDTWLEEHKKSAPEIKFDSESKPIIPDIIKELWYSVKTKDPEKTCLFGTKWLVGAIATWFSKECSNLELIFSGEMEKGKTGFVKYLLPPDLRRYYIKNSLIKKNEDDKIAMCQSLLMNQDECGGRSKKSADEHKEFLEMDYFYIRRPYRKDPENMKRMCALFGTTNHINDILTDKFGNRKTIVMEVLGRDFEVYDAINKDELWIACYALWKSGFQWKILGDEIKVLNEYTKAHEAHGVCYELINKYFEKPFTWADPENVKFTATDIKDYIEKHSMQKLQYKEVIGELYRMKFEYFEITERSVTSRRFCIKEKATNLKVENGEEAPF